MAEIWSEFLGKKVRYTGEDLDAFEQQFRQEGSVLSAFDIPYAVSGLPGTRFLRAEEGDSKGSQIWWAIRRAATGTRETIQAWQNT